LEIQGSSDDTEVCSTQFLGLCCKNRVSRMKGILKQVGKRNDQI
jgi:hypothetical protein